MRWTEENRSREKEARWLSPPYSYESPRMLARLESFLCFGNIFEKLSQSQEGNRRLAEAERVVEIGKLRHLGAEPGAAERKRELLRGL